MDKNILKISGQFLFPYIFKGMDLIFQKEPLIYNAHFLSEATEDGCQENLLCI